MSVPSPHEDQPASVVQEMHAPHGAQQWYGQSHDAVLVPAVHADTAPRLCSSTGAATSLS
jgi:hypothetical protein